jgi:hypothetical protein
VSLKPVALMSIVILHLFSSSASPQERAVNAEKVITEARAAYYSLTRHGFNGFQAAIEPDWKVILADTATKENLKVFRALRFSMIVDASGAVTVNREFGSPQPSVKQLHDHIQRLLSSFFGSWAFYMISSPFPEFQSKIERVENGYRLSYRVQSTDVILSMSSDFLITEGQLSDSTARRTIGPVFQKTSEGFVLLGYHTVFEPRAQGNKTTLDTTIEYHDVGGMRLPSKIHIKGMYGVEPVEADLRFSQYVLNQ